MTFPVAEQRHDFWNAAFSPVILNSTVFFYHSVEFFQVIDKFAHLLLAQITRKYHNPQYIEAETSKTYRLEACP